MKCKALKLKVLGALHYVIDATSEFIVEVNPGMSSNPYPDNIPHYFLRWIKEAFGGDEIE